MTKKKPARKVVPLSIDPELAARIEAAKRRRAHAQPKEAHVMKELMRMGLDLDERRKP